MEALKIYTNERDQNCCECRETIKVNQKFVWRHRQLRLQGEKILDISPCCLPCAKEHGWLD